MRKRFLYAALICFAIAALAMYGCIKELQNVPCIEQAHALPYVPEAEGDYWQTPDETWENGGDCEDKAIWCRDCLKKQGIETQLIVGKRNGQAHVWLIWKGFVIDPTWYGEMIPAEKVSGLYSY